MTTHTLEAAIDSVTASANALIVRVEVQQTGINADRAGFAATTTRVNALNLVDNTTDALKPISTPQQNAINLKQNTLVSGLNISTVNGLSLMSGLPLVIERSATSRNSVAYDNRGTLRTTVSQLDDSTGVEGLGLFQWVNTQLEPDDDETCFNTPAVSTLVGSPPALTVTTPAGQWLLREPAWDLIDAWNQIEQVITDDWREDEAIRFKAYLTNPI